MCMHNFVTCLTTYLHSSYKFTFSVQTSVTATSMLYALARNPDVQERLREEVLSVVGEHDVPTVQHLQKLHFAKNIITETLR